MARQKPGGKPTVAEREGARTSACAARNAQPGCRESVILLSDISVTLTLGRPGRAYIKWTPDEDALLLRIKRESTTLTRAVAHENFPARTLMSCRSRWRKIRGRAHEQRGGALRLGSRGYWFAE